jgi:hypothetical protein
MLLSSAIAQMCHSDAMAFTEADEVSLCTTTLVFPEGITISSSQVGDQEARYILVIREALPQVWRQVETLLQANGWQRLSKTATRQDSTRIYTCEQHQLSVALRQLGRSFRYQLTLVPVIAE